MRPIFAWFSGSMAIEWDQAYFDAIAHVSVERSVAIHDGAGYPGLPLENADLLVRLTSTDLALTISFKDLLEKDLATQSRARQAMRLLYPLIGTADDGITEALRSTMQSSYESGSLWVAFVGDFIEFRQLLIKALDQIVVMRTHFELALAAESAATATINRNLPVSTREAELGLREDIGFGYGGV